MDKEWVNITGQDHSDFHFFKVTVDLPSHSPSRPAPTPATGWDKPSLLLDARTGGRMISSNETSIKPRNPAMKRPQLLYTNCPAACHPAGFQAAKLRPRKIPMLQ